MTHLWFEQEEHQGLFVFYQFLPKLHLDCNIEFEMSAPDVEICKVEV